MAHPSLVATRCTKPDGQACVHQCQAYKAPADPSALELCRECGHAQSWHQGADPFLTSSSSLSTAAAEISTLQPAASEPQAVNDVSPSGSTSSNPASSSSSMLAAQAEKLLNQMQASARNASSTPKIPRLRVSSLSPSKAASMASNLTKPGMYERPSIAAADAETKRGLRPAGGSQAKVRSAFAISILHSHSVAAKTRYF